MEARKTLNKIQSDIETNSTVNINDIISIIESVVTETEDITEAIGAIVTDDESRKKADTALKIINICAVSAVLIAEIIRIIVG